MPIAPTRLQPGDAMEFAGDRQSMPVDQAAQKIPQQWQAFMTKVPLPGQVGKETYGITCGWDGENLEYLAGVRVAGFGLLTDAHPVGRVKVPAADYAVFVHRGPNDKIQQTWMDIMEWANGNGRYVPGDSPPLEIYGDSYNPTGIDSQFEIWFPVKLASAA